MTDDLALKFVGDSRTDIEGWLAPYGGPDYLGGKDWHGEFFSPATDFALEWFGDWQRPLLYQHGLDDAIKTEVVGRIKVERRDKGLWMQAQLDAAHEYHGEIAALLTEGALGASSGSVAHLVQTDRKSGAIKRWPLIEGSLTPTPANPDATMGYAVKSADAVLHLGVLGTEAPAEVAGGEVSAPEPVNVGDQGPEVIVPLSTRSIVLTIDGDALFRWIDAATKAGARNSAADLTHIQSAHDAMVALGATCSPTESATASKSEAAPVAPEPAAMAVAIKAPEPTANAADIEALGELMTSHAIKVARDLLRV